MNDISLEVILRIVFGMTDEARLAEIRPLLQRLVKIGPTSSSSAGSTRVLENTARGSGSSS